MILAAHTGHGGSKTIRGSSDLEAYWESKLTLGHGGSGVILSAEHRESDSRTRLEYRIVHDRDTDGVQLAPADQAKDLLGRIDRYLVEHPGASTEEVVKRVTGKSERIRQALRDGEASGRFVDQTKAVADVRGRPRTVSAWFSAGVPFFSSVPAEGRLEDGGTADG